MVPLAVLSRLGPWLARAGSAVLPKAFNAVSKASGTAVSSVDDVVKYAKASPGNALIVMSSLATAGFAVSDLWSPGDKADPESRSLAASLAVAELRATNQRLIEIGGDSESLAGLSGNRADLVLLQRVLRWARGHYGSPASAMEAHMSQQAFFELSFDDIKSGFEILDI